MREELESRLYFYSENIEANRKFLKQVKFFIPVTDRSRRIVLMSLVESVISRGRINTLLSEYTYYYPYN